MYTLIIAGLTSIKYDSYVQMINDAWIFAAGRECRFVKDGEVIGGMRKGADRIWSVR